MKPTLVTRTIGSMIVMREGWDTPLDEEWDKFLKLLVSYGENLSLLKILVVTDGGGPNRAQRKRLELALDGKSVRVAVVTDSAKSRFIASAIALINRHHRGFSISEFAGAYQHLDMSPSECRSAETALTEMDLLIKRRRD